MSYHIIQNDFIWLKLLISYAHMNPLTISDSNNYAQAMLIFQTLLTFSTLGSTFHQMLYLISSSTRSSKNKVVKTTKFIISWITTTSINLVLN